MVGPADPNRHLSVRNGFYNYKRRVPANIGALDSRFPTVRQALGTRDLGEARLKRDAHERADDQFWASLCEGSDQSRAEARYKSAISRAKALGFTYRHLSAILSEESGEEILARLRALHSVKPATPEEAALLGAVPIPKVTLQAAFELYVEKIAASDNVSKSTEQLKSWRVTKQRAITAFEAVCGPRNIGDITRDDARAFHGWWLEKIAPNRKEGKVATHSASSGNRDIGNLRNLFRRYHEYLGQNDIVNPFEGLSFAEKKTNTRPSFPNAWIVDRFLKRDALLGLNDEARGIVYAMIETGCRPSEIANLYAENIFLDGDLPYIKIAPRVDLRNPRELKSSNSEREIPLLGVSLAAMRKFPNGFPRYRENGNGLSAVLNKFFTENGLCPTDKHTVYSFRHSFEDRAKEAGMDSELRKIMMGHGIDRPKYGSGGALEWKRQELSKMTFAFDFEYD